MQSQRRQLESDPKAAPYPLVMLHSRTAQDLGLKDGQWASVLSPKGKVRMRLKTSEIIRPKMADAQHGWCFPER